MLAFTATRILTRDYPDSQTKVYPDDPLSIWRCGANVLGGFGGIFVISLRSKG
jgi:hypothetical protein